MQLDLIGIRVKADATTAVDAMFLSMNDEAVEVEVFLTHCDLDEEMEISNATV